MADNATGRAQGPAQKLTPDHHDEDQGKNTPRGYPKQDPWTEPERPALADWRRKDLHASGITDEVIDRLGIHDAPDGKGWVLPWTDGENWTSGPHEGMSGFELVIPDRDKRPADGRKVLWPKGQTLYPGIIRHAPDPSLVAYVEGQRQALAFASWAPSDVEVWCLPGIQGIHNGVRDRLPRFVRGRRVLLVPDADWRNNGQVGRAALETVPAVLAEVGAVEVLVADVGGIGKDGVDDILGRTVPELRAKVPKRVAASYSPP